MEDQERRSYKRVAVDLFCTLTTSNGVKHTATARNISIGGVFVECERPFSKSDQVTVALNLQFGGRLRKIEAKSEVIHGPTRISMTAYGTGLRFLELNQDAKEVVEEYIEVRPAIS